MSAKLTENQFLDSLHYSHILLLLESKPCQKSSAVINSTVMIAVAATTKIIPSAFLYSWLNSFFSGAGTIICFSVPNRI